MKKLLIIFLFAGLTALNFSIDKTEFNTIPDAYSGPTQKVPLRAWVYLDLIITDYNTGVPEGHFLYNLAKPAVSAGQVMDMQVKAAQSMSGDFGNASIYYGTNSDILFSGTVVWDGTGSMTFPAALDTNIAEDKLMLAKPAYIQYLNKDSASVDSEYLQKADVAWTHVSKMQVLSGYQGVAFKTAFFLYTPSVGITDLNKAKWVILLERDAGSW